MIPSPSHSLLIAVQSGMVNINQLNEKLQKLQNRAACRVITKSSYEVNSLLMDALGWEKLISNRQKLKAVMVFKSLHNLTPVYLHNVL